MSRSPKHTPDQGQILCCSLCGHTWTTMDSTIIESIRLHPATVVLCDPCCYIEMAKRCANNQGTSLRSAVRRYLLGCMKKTGRDLKQLWKGTVA